MTLKGYIYDVDSVDFANGTFSVSLINDCPLFAGHFPGNPILPGATVLDMLTEMLCEALGVQVSFRSIKSVKFMAPIIPDGGTLNLVFEYSISPDMEIRASVSHSGQVCVKISGLLAQK